MDDLIIFIELSLIVNFIPNIGINILFVLLNLFQRDNKSRNLLGINYVNSKVITVIYRIIDSFPLILK